MILSIRNYGIALNRINAIAYEEGKTLIFCHADDVPFTFEDAAGTDYSAVMETWRGYLEQYRNDIRGAIEYGIVLASERGNI